ncbi:NAD(P)-dependent alcohol dehydrogenase [Halalkalicoccus jeotgali]|uniref:Alcohol dehydrogenase n=1 Tax=Halalkalicoccus jeotgali (strain DSM 18796 / CECT 7217 / JCM 14584 / KCTC 4019 / B3) TaxID=795797 RepID=D8J415_HALJB|nr:NAD(P)-dependent alcohol dehydrogenase [Halalkalicoccus jeotgali]ADJ15407.1 alcohol dehydrogenase [Halalkalicoccus jeotgali B3]ELY35817.1 alcohol dehydrogenase [Halalkalicoccus jeotgali B3]
MDAARLHDYTEEMGEALSIDEVERPEPTRSDHVVIEVEGAGWCQTDNHIIEGMWTDYVEQDLPMTLGHENAGEVVEIGEEVTTVEVGDKVICHPHVTCGECRACRLGEDMHCENASFPGLNVDGGFAEYLLTSERAAIKLDSVDPVEIAPHADAGITAYHAVKKATPNLFPGSYTVVIGIGGLGHIGLQAVEAMSASTTIAVDVKDEALSLADRLGADHTINSADEDVAEAIAGITDGAGAEQVLDFVGADQTTALAPEIVAPGGDHHIIGYGGHIHEPAQALVNGEFSFVGNIVGKYTELQELVSLVEQGEMHLETTQYPIEEINDVAAALEEGEIEGRAVIVP